ncbi:hypothetical protein DICVIV_10261 [Dictyocaulus viviparus]|uniref:Uncharacterized protein n=1 Tax=Dictyocaulus viviparus TaxID=29172 RepID=A0A0D8XGE5_DICVI|nr:hypothetical protein DICVIV_10261 [Dictyocaulus viviparus]
MCCRESDQTCNSAVFPTLADSRLSSPLCARPESPIYAQPWAHHQSESEHRYPNVRLAKQRSFPSQALTVRNQLFHYMKPEIPYNEYAKPFDIETSTGDCPKGTTSLVDREPCFPSACCEIIAKRQMSRNSALEKTDEEFLSELDAQIAELQMRSDELRSIVEKACQRRHAANWLRPSMNCTFELSI